MSSSVEDGTTTAAAASSSSAEEGESMYVASEIEVPLSFDQMVRQAAAAMRDAYDKGMKRQTVRILLPRDPSSGQIGRYFEPDAQLDTTELILAPPDESWQGGIMQLYRSCEPACEEILRYYSPVEGGLPPRITEDRSIDESGVDGMGLLITENVSPSEDVSCFVQPSQETTDAVESICDQAGDRLVVLINPQWRDVDDALDTYSKDEGFMGQLASFLGGKGNTLKRLSGLGFELAYTLDGYVCKGGNIRLFKRFDTDWNVFAENDSATDYIKVGTSKTRPTYQDVEKMLDDKGISLKYARDFGLAPKL